MSAPFDHIRATLTTIEEVYRHLRGGGVAAQWDVEPPVNGVILIQHTRLPGVWLKYRPPLPCNLSEMLKAVNESLKQARADAMTQEG